MVIRTWRILLSAAVLDQLLARNLFVFVKPLGGAERLVGTGYNIPRTATCRPVLDTGTLFADSGSLRACRFVTAVWWRPPVRMEETCPSPEHRPESLSADWGRRTLARAESIAVMFVLQRPHRASRSRARCASHGEHTSGCSMEVPRGDLSYSPNRLYHIHMRVLTASQLYDVYVTPEGGIEEPLAP